MTTPTDQYNHTIDYDPDNDAIETVTDDDAPKSRRRGRKSADKAAHEEATESHEPRRWPAFIRFFLDKRTHAVTGIVLILVAAYLLIAAMSYFSTAADDQSKLNNLTVEQMIERGLTVDNITGPAGAVAAHMLLTHGLGIGSLVLVVYLAILGLSLIGAKKTLHFWSLTLKCLVSAIGVSLIVGLLDLYFNFESVFPYGGYHGRYINLWLIARIQWIGAIGVSLVLASILLYMYINDLIKFFGRVKVAYGKVRPAVANAVDEKAEAFGDELEGEPEPEPEDDHSAYMPKESDDAAETSTEPEMMPVSVSFDDGSITREDNIIPEVKTVVDDEPADDPEDEEPEIIGVVQETAEDDKDDKPEEQIGRAHV